MLCIRWKALAKKSKGGKIPLKEDDQHQIEKASSNLKKALEAKQSATSNEEKLAASKAEAEAREFIKAVYNFYHLTLKLILIYFS